MTITYYNNFSKRINSTKQPTGGTNITTVRLKEPCSVERPVFEMATIPTTANYIKWGNNYYYVTGITYQTNSIVEVACELDVLATFKSNITATKAFIEYSQYNYNANILDPRISNQYSTTQSIATVSITGLTSAAGSYLLSCVSSRGTAVTYICNSTALQLLGIEISSTISDTLADNFVKRFGSLYDCVLGCVWVPFDYNWIPSTSTIKLGSYDTGIACGEIWPLFNYSSTYSISIPWIHNSTDNICRRCNEKITLYLPGYGITELSASALNYAASLNIVIYYDRTGSMVYKVSTPNGGFSALYNVNVGVQVPVTRFTQSVRGMFAQGQASNYEKLPERMTEGVTGKINSWIADISGRLTNIGSIQASTGGDAGGAGAADLHYNPTIKVINTSFTYCEDQADMADRYGRPYFAVNTISNMLSSNKGYVKTNGASVDIPGFEDEKDKVSGFLNGGVFIE